MNTESINDCANCLKHFVVKNGWNSEYCSEACKNEAMKEITKENTEES